MGEHSASVDLAVSADELWDSVCRLDGINYELGPWLRMTAPAGLAGATIDELEPGLPAGRSWLLLGGVLPVDYDDLCLAEIEPRRFLERSRMLTMDPWQHERSVRPLDAASARLTDRLRFELRSPLAAVPGAGKLAAASVAAIFRHRHRRLAKLYGHPRSHRGETDRR